MKRKVLFQHCVIKGVTKRNKNEEKEKDVQKLKFCLQKLSNSDPFAHFLWWVDAHFMVGQRTFSGKLQEHFYFIFFKFMKV